MRRGLLLVGHGSRSPSTRVEHDALELRMRGFFPEWRVASGFIELSDPPLAIALTELAQACDQLVVSPLLLFSGGHMQRDVPHAVEQARRVAPQTQIVVSDPFGLEPHAIGLASERLRRHQRVGSPSAVLVVGRGATEAQSQQEFQRVVAEVERRHASHSVEVAYCGVQAPNVTDALTALAAAGREHVIVVPYLLFTGRLLSEVALAVDAANQRHGSMRVELAGHLGPDAADAVVARVRAALPG